MAKTKILTTRGAASLLGVSVSLIHKMVKDGKLRAYAPDASGELVEHPKDARRQGTDLFFYESDLNKFRSPLEKQKGRRYTDEERQEVMMRYAELHAQGKSNREIAEAVGVSYQTINNWAKCEEVHEHKQAKNVA